MVEVAMAVHFLELHKSASSSSLLGIWANLLRVVPVVGGSKGEIHETCSSPLCPSRRLGTCGVVRGHRSCTTYLVVSVALSFIIYCRLLPSVISCFRLVAAAAPTGMWAEGRGRLKPNCTKQGILATLPSLSLPTAITNVMQKSWTKNIPIQLGYSNIQTVL